MPGAPLSLFLIPIVQAYGGRFESANRVLSQVEMSGSFSRNHLLSRGKDY